MVLLAELAPVQPHVPDEESQINNLSSIGAFVRGLPYKCQHLIHMHFFFYYYWSYITWDKNVTTTVTTLKQQWAVSRSTPQWTFHLSEPAVTHSWTDQCGSIGDWEGDFETAQLPSAWNETNIWGTLESKNACVFSSPYFDNYTSDRWKQRHQGLSLVVMMT